MENSEDLEKAKSIEESLDGIDDLLDGIGERSEWIDAELSRLEKDVRQIGRRLKIKFFLERIRRWKP